MSNFFHTLIKDSQNRTLFSVFHLNAFIKAFVLFYMVFSAGLTLSHSHEDPDDLHNQNSSEIPAGYSDDCVLCFFSVSDLPGDSNPNIIPNYQDIPLSSVQSVDQDDHANATLKLRGPPLFLHI